MICRRTSVRRVGTPRARIAEGFVRQLGEAHWEIRIHRELKSPNKTLGAHWIRKQQERQAWETAILLAIARYAGMDTVAGAQLLRRALSVFVGPGVRERRRVVVTRLVPKRANFVKDDDNLAFVGKPLFDAMKRAGLLFDDKREFLDAPRPTQAVSPEGRYETVIEIQRLGIVALPPTTRRARAAGGLHVDSQ